jgi:hypothetical protein
MIDRNRRALSGLSRVANAPGSQQAEQRLLLKIEPHVTGAHYAQMTRPEILDRSAVEILLDDGGADV